MMRRTKFAMYGYFLPNLSPRIPKMAAPTDRSINVNVIAHVIAAGSLSNDSAMLETVNETLKKSNASYFSQPDIQTEGSNTHAHPRNPMNQNAHCRRLSIRRTVYGFMGISPGGLSEMIWCLTYEGQFLIF